MGTSSYLIDLAKIQLFDMATGNSSWIQALPLGNYHHPVYGDIKVTPDRITRFADNIKNKVREQDLDIDYDHKAKDGRAAGWVRDADARPDGLWVLVEWTDAAASALRAKEYRYFSPEFADEWEHPKTKQKFQDVMFGGALTNRPFLKDILPINLSEVFNAEKGTNSMDPLKEIAKLLGLSEDVPAEDVIKKLQEHIGQTKTLSDEMASLKQKLTEPKSPAEDHLKKLAETDASVKLLLEEREANAKRLAALEMANKLSEVNLKLSEIDRDAKFVIPPAIKDQVRDLAISSPKETGEIVMKLLSELASKGLVELGERGGSRITTDEPASKQFSDKVTALMKANEKLDYADAVTQVAADNPELFEQYRHEATQKA